MNIIIRSRFIPAGVLFVFLSVIISFSSYAQNPEFSTDSLIFYQHTGGNYLQNGSFELGLGAEPFYPGWMTEEASASGKAPEKPFIESGDAADGNKCLCIKNVKPHTYLTMDIVYPNITGHTGTYYLTFKVKSSRANVAVKPSIGLPGHLITESEVNQWVTVQFSYNFDTVYKELRFYAVSNSNENFDIRFDSFTLSQNSDASGNWYPADEAEAVLVPTVKSNGIHFTEDGVKLKYVINSQNPKNVNLELHLVDISREGAVSYPYYASSTAVGPEPVEGEIDLGNLKTGAYLALLAVSDSSSHQLLTVGREKFTVFYNLSDVPPPEDFVVGMHGGYRTFSDPGSLEFCWRGHWDSDEYFQNAYQIGIRMQRIFCASEFSQAYKNAFFWKRTEDQVDSAYRNGCQTMLSLLFGQRRDPVANPVDPESPGGWFINKSVMIPFARNVSAMDQLSLITDRDNVKKMASEIARRFGSRISCLEVQNEVNLLMYPELAVEYVYEPVYEAYKKFDTSTPVVMNQTMDGVYSKDGRHFTQLFFRNGGGKYTDGFTYHPYVRETIAKQGIEYMRLNRDFKESFTEPGKKFYMGMSEIHQIGVDGSPGWDLMQRVFLDWCAGSQWSAGVISDGLYFLESGYMKAWPGRGSRAPGKAAVALNTFYKLFGGCRFVKTVEKSDSILVALFEKRDGSGYLVAMAAADDPAQCPEINMDLSSIAYTEYDQFGGVVETPQNPFILTREFVYFQSQDKALFDAAENYTFTFKPSDLNYEYEHKLDEFAVTLPPEWWQEYQLTGLLPKKK